MSGTKRMLAILSWSFCCSLGPFPYSSSPASSRSPTTKTRGGEVPLVCIILYICQVRTVQPLRERLGRAQRAVFAAPQMFLEPCFLFCCWAICFYSLSFLQGGFERLPLLQWMFPVCLHQATFNENQFKVFFLIKCLIVALAAPLWK